MLVFVFDDSSVIGGELFTLFGQGSGHLAMPTVLETLGHEFFNGSSSVSMKSEWFAKLFRA